MLFYISCFYSIKNKRVVHICTYNYKDCADEPKRKKQLFDNNHNDYSTHKTTVSREDALQIQTKKEKTNGKLKTRSAYAHNKEI